MLPHDLSDDLLSLVPGADRDALTVHTEVDQLAPGRA